MSNFWDQVQAMADEAPEAGFPNLNYGKLTITPMVLTWTTKDDVRVPERRKLKDGEALKDGESLDLHFNIDIQEMNPNLEFTYDRNVTVLKSRDGGQQTDWSEIVMPSLIATFGDNWAKTAHNSYVEAEDVPQINPSGKVDKQGKEKVYKTIKFIRKFKDKAECIAARNLTYKSSDESGGSTDIPANVVEQASALVKSVGREAARSALEGKPFGDYDPDAVLATVPE